MCERVQSLWEEIAEKERNWDRMKKVAKYFLDSKDRDENNECRLGYRIFPYLWWN